MLFIEGHCPHCNEKRGFNLFSVSDYRSVRLGVDIKNGSSASNQKLGKQAQFFACGTCVFCKSPVLVDIALENDGYLYAMRDGIANPEKSYTGPMPTIVHMYPQPEPPYTHPALPEEVNKDLVDLQTMLKSGLAPHLVMTGCRTVLETSVKLLGGEGKNLAARIEDLKNKSIINGVLADWARHIRVEGNSATHERAGMQEEAQELMNFTKLFLQYTFEFPQRIEDLRQGKSA